MNVSLHRGQGPDPCYEGASDWLSVFARSRHGPQGSLRHAPGCVFRTIRLSVQMPVQVMFAAHNPLAECVIRTSHDGRLAEREAASDCALEGARADASM